MGIRESVKEIFSTSKSGGDGTGSAVSELGLSKGGPRVLLPYMPRDTGMTEAFKAMTEMPPKYSANRLFFKNKEIDHPHDFKALLDLYMKYGFVTGVIDKHVDFIVGSGFYVESEDKRAEKIVTDFNRDVNFDNILRAWIKTALLTGNGFIEIGNAKGEVPTDMKVLNPCYIYVQRDETGEVLGYSQIIEANKPAVLLDKENIVHLKLNCIADMAYGCGVLLPGLVYVNNLMGLQKEMHTLVKRKAGSPYVFKVGKPEAGIIPSQAELDAIGQRLENLSNKTEWVVDGSIDVSVVDFGKIGDKFADIIRHDEDQLFFTFQVPEVLMGRGSVPEGLANVQMQAWERRVQALQSEIEKVIETQLIQRLLAANNLGGVHVEFQWGERSDEDRREELTRIQQLLSLADLDSRLRVELEKKLAKLMDIDPKLLETPDEEREREDEEEQPRVPGQNNPSASYVPIHTEENDDRDYTLSEWLQFNFRDYEDYILKFIEKDDFGALSAQTVQEELAGKLTDNQVQKLKTVLKRGIQNGHSMRKIAEEIKFKVAPKDLYRTDENGEIVIARNGERALAMGAGFRPTAIARSEITRVSNAGAVEMYRANDIEYVRWIATPSERTCQQCLELNNKVFEISKFTGPPLHSMCRCSTLPVTKLEAL